MSEEKKNIELKDKELEKGNGGYLVNEADFEEGDCFEDKNYIYKVLHTVNRANMRSMIECLNYLKDSQLSIKNDVPASVLMNGCKYIGKDVI